MAQAVISNVFDSAHNTMVQRSDGSIVSLGEHKRAPGALTITGIFQGAHASVVKTSAGDIKPLSDHIRAAGGATVSQVLLGAYGGQIVSDKGILTLGGAQIDDEANP